MVNNRLATGTEKVVVVGVVSTSIQLMEIIKILKHFYLCVCLMNNYSNCMYNLVEIVDLYLKPFFW